MTKEEILEILYNDLENTFIDYHNEYTLNWSTGYRKGKWETYLKIKNLLDELEE